MDPTITLLEVHKLMYFLQAAGEPLQLAVREGLATGPTPRTYATFCQDVEGHLITGYAGEGDAPDVELALRARRRSRR